MITLREEVAKQNGELKKYKNYALRIQLPSMTSKDSLERLLALAQLEYGRDNLAFHINTGESLAYMDLVLFRKDVILADILKMTTPFGLSAEILEDIFTVGVGGDNRSYTPVVNLTGPNPGWDILENLSNRISNTMPINRVTYETARKT